MTGAAPDVFPCPVFEGSEKRISVTFSAAAGASNPPPAAGLRTLTRTQLDEMLDLAACQIVSTRSNEHFDAYVLSESSLFVYPGARAGLCPRAVAHCMTGSQFVAAHRLEQQARSSCREELASLQRCTPPGLAAQGAAQASAASSCCCGG